MIDQMRIANLATNTQTSYLFEVERMARRYGAPSADLDAEQVPDFVLTLIGRSLSPAMPNSTLSALRRIPFRLPVDDHKRAFDATDFAHCHRKIVLMPIIPCSAARQIERRQPLKVERIQCPDNVVEPLGRRWERQRLAPFPVLFAQVDQRVHTVHEPSVPPLGGDSSTAERDGHGRPLDPRVPLRDR